MRIEVQVVAGKIFHFEVEPSDSIDVLKQKLAVEGIPMKLQRLIVNDKNVTDACCSLSDCGIKANSVIKLVVRSDSGGMNAQGENYGEDYETTTLMFKTLTGRAFSLNVRSTDTFHMVKLKIEDKHGIPSVSQRLVSRNMLLEDARTVASCGLTTGAEVTLVVRCDSNHLNDGGMAMLEPSSMDEDAHAASKESVISIFESFDHSGDGTMARVEFVTLMQALGDPRWTSESIDKGLAGAGFVGDRLRFNGLIEWMFSDGP